MNRQERRRSSKRESARVPVSSWMSQLVRSSCSACSGPIQWMGMGEACDLLGFKLVNEFLDMLGNPNTDVVDVDFWRCRKCGHSGVLVDPDDI